MTHTNDVSGFHPQLLGWYRSLPHCQQAFLLSGRSLSVMVEAGGNMYQRYIFLQEGGGPSVWISTHMVHEKMEMRIDQRNINI